jgi:hypothetical protein
VKTMTSKAKIVARNAKPPRSKPSLALAVPAAAIATVVEHPGWAMMRDMHAMITGMQTTIDAMEAKINAAAVVHPSTMIVSAKALTIKQGCRVLSDMDDGRLYNRKHLIHNVGGNRYVDADEIRAEFPDEFNEARYREIVERCKPQRGHPAYVEKPQEPEPPPLSHLTGNDKAR